MQSASAKAGQFSKISVFDITGPTSISSPYQPGGPQGLKGTIKEPETTYGYTKSDGPILAKGYVEDVTREKAAFEVSSKIIREQVRHAASCTRRRRRGSCLRASPRSRRPPRARARWAAPMVFWGGKESQ